MADYNTITITLRDDPLRLLDGLRDEKRLSGRGAVVEWLLDYWRSHDEHDAEEYPDGH